MFLALFPIAKMWEQPKYPSADEWMDNRIWKIHTVEYCSVRNRSKVLYMHQHGQTLKILWQVKEFNSQKVT